MSENSTPEERTEMPTERRMGQIRKDGGLYLSSEVSQVISLTTGFLMLGVMWPYFIDDFKKCMVLTYRLIANSGEVDINFISAGFLGILRLFGPHLLLFIVVIASVAVLAVMLQTNWNIKEKKIHFRWNMLLPWNGLRRIFSAQGLVTTLKAIGKLMLILPIGFFALKGFAPHMIKLMHTSIESVFVFTGNAISTIFWRIWWLLLALAIADWLWGKHQWLKSNKMTKEEVKDERKAVEGDETTKRKIVAKGLQRIMNRILNSVPKAHVVITNPTHYAVALRYDRNEMAAPVVVAKGKGFIALKIREIARQNGVPIMERKTLARALFASTEVGAQIPNELFRAVAEVLAYIFRMKGKQQTVTSAG